MDVQQLEEFLAENKDDESVRQVLHRFVPKDINQLMEDEDFAKRLNSYLDSEKSKAVASYEAKTLPKKVQEQVERELENRNKKEPWQLELEKMQSQLEETNRKLAEKEQAERREQLRNKALQQATEKKLPTKLVDFVVADDEETTNQNLELLEKTLADYGKSIKQNIYQSNNPEVPANETDGKPGEPGPNATKEQWKQYYANQRK